MEGRETAARKCEEGPTSHDRVRVERETRVDSRAASHRPKAGAHCTRQLMRSCADICPFSWVRSAEPHPVGPPQLLSLELCPGSCSKLMRVYRILEMFKGDTAPHILSDTSGLQGLLFLNLVLGYSFRRYLYLCEATFWLLI